jgi:hypothetical protein
MGSIPRFPHPRRPGKEAFPGHQAVREAGNGTPFAFTSCALQRTEHSPSEPALDGWGTGYFPAPPSHSLLRKQSSRQGSSQRQSGSFSSEGLDRTLYASSLYVHCKCLSRSSLQGCLYEGWTALFDNRCTQPGERKRAAPSGSLLQADGQDVRLTRPPAAWGAERRLLPEFISWWVTQIQSESG